jgi:hypothetical protein
MTLSVFAFRPHINDGQLIPKRKKFRKVDDHLAKIKVSTRERTQIYSKMKKT